MKKFTLIALTIICFSLHSYSQDMGYNTFDIGVEYKWADNSPAYNIQGAFNAKIHHSLILSAGIKTAYRPITGTHNNEKGRGWGGALGYRYYFSVLPKGLYLGIRGEIWNMNMYRTANLTDETTKVLIFQPNVEIGHTFLINDLFFVTTYLSGGQQITISSGGDKFNYGRGFVPSAGISAGWRF